MQPDGVTSQCRMLSNEQTILSFLAHLLSAHISLQSPINLHLVRSDLIINIVYIFAIHSSLPIEHSPCNITECISQHLPLSLLAYSSYQMIR